MTAFDTAFALTVGVEGGFTANPLDPGNWTGGRCNAGQCKGTKFGVSAASYPTLTIADLSLDDAKAIYKRDYWDKVRGDDLPAPLALMVFDAAVNSGVSRASMWLQTAVGAAADGAIGSKTLAAVQARAGHGADVVTEYAAQRLAFLANLPTWRTFGLGWARRVCGMERHALTMGSAA